MKTLVDIGLEARQRFILPVDELETDCYLTLEYSPNQYSWFYTLECGDVFSTFNERLPIGMNVLRQFRGRIPFGLAVLAASGMDPIVQDAFSSGDVTISVLSADEVQSVEALYREQSD